ncbi:hypothetical protein C0J52_18785 [Blattella germanica]|nr:hypothetical protein C0J52_18785 [Blattella germanica]
MKMFYRRLPCLLTRSTGTCILFTVSVMEMLLQLKENDGNKMVNKMKVPVRLDSKHGRCSFFFLLTTSLFELICISLEYQEHMETLNN